MNLKVRAHFEEALKHLYINPLEKCNLRCKICYTKKTNPILLNSEILNFISRYQAAQQLDTITFCGGEVFALANFPELVNQLTDQGLFIQIITNGTINKLAELKNPNSINLIVSLDGLSGIHDLNRGLGNFAKSLEFLKQAIKLGFQTEIFSIVHQQNLNFLDEFEKELQKDLGHLPPVTYHPRKPPQYLSSHPIANIMGETKDFEFLTRAQMVTVMKTRQVFPPKKLGCYQIAVASDGQVYGCCEGTLAIGKMSDSIESLIAKLESRLTGWAESNQWTGCLGCSQPDFMCGIKSYLEELYAN